MRRLATELQQIAVLGATGRLGRAVVRALGPHRVIGLSRHAAPNLQIRHITGDRRDVLALQRAIADADAVVDLCGFDADDAQALLRAVARPKPLIAVSSIAERVPAWWDRAETDLGPLPDDPYGTGKRAYSTLLLQRWRGPLLVPLSPQLLVADDPDERSLAYLRAAQSGTVAVPGTGQQRVATVAACDVAHLFDRWLAAPTLSGRVQISHPHPESLADLVQALLAGAGLTAALAFGGQSGQHSGGEELLDLSLQNQLWPDYPWQPLTSDFRVLGQKWRDRLRDRSAD